MTRTIFAAFGAAVLAASAPAVAAPAERTADSGDEVRDLDRVICRRDSVVGSRVQKRRTCKTAREWAKESTDIRDRWTEFVKASNGAVPTN